MTCRIDHADPEAIPRIMCRLCNPINGAAHPYARAASPEPEPERYSTLVPRTVNLTSEDLKAIAELNDTRAAARKDKANGRIAKMKKRLESKTIPEGARWDTKCCKWITPGEQSTNGQ